ncbi:MAG: hypothetical protein ABG776_14090, partial [Cyanobacteria bacterium J06555_13]
MHTQREGKAYVHRESLGPLYCKAFDSKSVFKPGDQRYSCAHHILRGFGEVGNRVCFPKAIASVHRMSTLAIVSIMRLL